MFPFFFFFFFSFSFLLQAVDDDIPEEKRVYELSLTSLTPGADISLSHQRATITMAASDLPYGLFSFSQSSLSVMEDEKSVSYIFYLVLVILHGDLLFSASHWHSTW